ncbi:hypothetical protein ACJX0J_010934, partial [Zea mays]
LALLAVQKKNKNKKKTYHVQIIYKRVSASFLATKIQELRDFVNEPPQQMILPNHIIDVVNYLNY